MITRNRAFLTAAALAAAVPTAALAQSATTTDSMPMSDVQRDDDNEDFPWGLLGLLGLAGLLGRKRDDHSRDNRTNSSKL